jgi:hypothetical protein
MITITTVNQAIKEFIKVLRFGNSDYQTGQQYLPSGVDSKPTKGKKAAHATTTNKNDSIILGYRIESDITKPGEIRIFATDESGAEVFQLLLKNNGTAEFGGNSDNLVRFQKLQDEMTSLANFMNEEYTKIATGISAGGGSYTPGIANIDISESKIEEIKTS